MSYKFNSAEEMLEAINNEDLYNPVLGIYVFLYNEAGSIAAYDIDENEARKLAGLSKKHNDYWGAFLGIGGSIYDDPSYDYFDEEMSSNIDWCEKYHTDDNWVSTDEYAENLSCEKKDNLVVLIYNIEWDFSDFEEDEENEEELPDIPTSITHHFPYCDLSSLEEKENFEETVSDWLSDEYGYCHYGFEYRILNVGKE